MSRATSLPFQSVLTSCVPSLLFSAFRKVLKRIATPFFAPLHGNITVALIGRVSSKPPPPSSPMNAWPLWTSQAGLNP